MSTRPASIAEVTSTVDAEGIISIDDGKIKKKILKEGNGPTPADRSDVTVHYTGRLLDGTVFDSSRTRNDPFVFKIGKGQVIKGWDRGVATMKVGETAILTCAPDYAYGARGSPPKIPPNATLEFEVELLSFDNTQKVTEDGGVKKSTQSVGDGSPNRPNDQAVVMIKYRGRVKGNDKPFVDHWGEAVEMKLGVDPANVWGLEEGIKNMHTGEKSVLFIQPGYGYAQKGDEKLSIPPNAELEYDVELISFTRSKDAGELDFDAKKAYMNSLKELGNGVFKLGVNLDRAEKLYRKCVDVFPYEGALDDDQKKAVQAIKISAMSNHALCKFKKQEWEAVVGHADAALEIEPKHVKCLYYRGVSRLRLGDVPAAQADFEAALAVDPSNKDCARELNEIKRKRKAELDREKKTFGGFFNKVKLVSAEEEAQAAKEHAEAEARRKQASGEEDSDSEVEADTSSEEAAPAQKE